MGSKCEDCGAYTDASLESMRMRQKRDESVVELLERCAGYDNWGERDPRNLAADRIRELELEVAAVNAARVGGAQAFVNKLDGVAVALSAADALYNETADHMSHAADGGCHDNPAERKRGRGLCPIVLAREAYEQALTQEVSGEPGPPSPVFLKLVDKVTEGLRDDLCDGETPKHCEPGNCNPQCLPCYRLNIARIAYGLEPVGFYKEGATS